MRPDTLRNALAFGQLLGRPIKGPLTASGGRNGPLFRAHGLVAVRFMFVFKCANLVKIGTLIIAPFHLG